MDNKDMLKIMQMAKELNDVEWISVLINLSNKGQTKQFFQMIGQNKIFNKYIQKER